MAVLRWVFHDPTVPEDYTFPRNPSEMTSIHRVRSITVEPTALTVGSNLYWEGNVQPREWSFSGRILDHDHYMELLSWVQRRHRLRVTDHYGRQFWILIENYEFVPRRSAQRPWSHTYEVSGFIITEPTAPTEHIDQ